MHSPTPTAITNAVALSLWADTRDESITRESAARVAEKWQIAGVGLPPDASAEWRDGWEMACETIALSLRFRT